MELDLGSEKVSYVAWKAQKETWDIDGNECKIKRFIIDPDSIKTGQGKLAANTAPIWEWNPSPDIRTQLKEGFKKAFSIKIYLSDKYGAPETGWREWTTNQRASRDALQNIWKDIAANKKQNQGKGAILDFTGTESIKYGDNAVTVPKLKLTGWVDMPKDNQPEPEPEPELTDDLEF